MLQGRATPHVFFVLPPFFSDGASDLATLHSPRQSWWQTRVISNHLDILPKQHQLWENDPISGYAPIILYLLPADDGLTPLLTSTDSVLQASILTRSWKSWTHCLQHPFGHPSEASRGLCAERQRANEGRLSLKKALNSSLCMHFDAHGAWQKVNNRVFWEVMSWKESVGLEKWDSAATFFRTLIPSSLPVSVKGTSDSPFDYQMALFRSLPSIQLWAAHARHMQKKTTIFVLSSFLHQNSPSWSRRVVQVVI